ncbi:MAG: Uma2 family endonuclease [Synechococcales bacterium]|nr:Uma2 family endonuclease [Synechococcales bacterium]
MNTLSTPKTTSTSKVTDTWVQATWEEFLIESENSEIEKLRCYYDRGWMRIETMAIGFSHGKDNATLMMVVTLYGTFRNIAFLSLMNTSFQKPRQRECQPDLAFYIGQPLPTIPRTNAPISIDEYGPPTLAIEIAATSLSDDLGQKRLLYERLGVVEYWVVNVETATVTAFAVKDGGSWQIQTSQALPGLTIAIVEEALHRSQTEDDGAINRWLIQQFSQPVTPAENG